MISAGLSGAGKTTVGRALYERLKRKKQDCVICRNRQCHPLVFAVNHKSHDDAGKPFQCSLTLEATAEFC